MAFIDHVHRLITWGDSRWEFSPGVLAQLLILIPFIPFRRKTALSKISEIYTEMDLELLIYLPVYSSEPNDDMLGRLPDFNGIVYKIP